jgi:hypothetical protein
MNSQDKAISYLDSLHYITYYTDSKWKMYLKYCDKQIVKNDFGEEIKEPKYFGELPIFLTSARMENDSLLALTFESVLFDSIFVNNNSFKDSSLKYTFNRYLYYNIQRNSLYGYGIGSAICVDSMELNDYCNKVPKCDKKKFIEEHKNQLNEWFIKETVRRRFINE